MTPIVIGVAGGSGSGKTTVVRRIVDSLGDEQVTVLEHDRYYRDRNDLRLEERAALNYDHPDSLETDLLVRHVHGAARRQADRGAGLRFARHARTPATDRSRRGARIIVEGILVFADAALRGLMDIKVFVDTDADTRFIRRLQRDVAERGRTMESVIEQYLTTVKPMHLEFVEPSKRYADVIMPLGGHNTVAVDLLLSLIRGLAGGRAGRVGRRGRLAVRRLRSGGWRRRAEGSARCRRGLRAGAGGPRRRRQSAPSKPSSPCSSLRLEIDGQPVAGPARARRQRRQRRLVDARGEEAVADGVAAKMSANDGAMTTRKPAVEQRPGGMLARRAAAEVHAGDEDRRAGVVRLVQHERRIALPRPPVVEQERAEARSLDPLQELLRDDLIGVDVVARSGATRPRCW